MVEGQYKQTAFSRLFRPFLATTLGPFESFCLQMKVNCFER